ncbi:helix-turn-helix transcriptional regulator, partial [Enterococcus hirae]
MRSNDEIVEIIDLKRKEKELSISELARRVGMAKSALSRYFNRTREFPLNRVEEFAKVLGISSEYLLGFEEDLDSNSSIEKIYNQLSPPRQQKVYNFAKQELKEQQEQNKAVIPIEKEE